MKLKLKLKKIKTQKPSSYRVFFFVLIKARWPDISLDHKMTWS